MNVERRWIPTLIKLRHNVSVKGRTFWKGTKFEVDSFDMATNKVEVSEGSFKLSLARSAYETIWRKRLNDEENTVESQAKRD